MTNAKSNKSNDDATPPTFEESLSQLEEVVRVLEDGRLGLDESLARYEEGVRLLKTCHDSLNRAERKISLLTGVDANGQPITEPFEESATTLEEKKESRSKRRSRSKTNDAAAPAWNDLASTEPDDDNHDMDRQKGLF